MHFISHDQCGHDAFLRGYHSLHFPESDRARAIAHSLEDAVKSQSAVLDALRAEIAETKKAAAASGQPSAPFAANDCTYGDGPRHAAAQPSSPVSYWRAPWYRRPWAYAI